MELRTRYWACFVLGIVSSAASIGAGLALQDISHGEQDLTLEWRMLQVSFPIILLFHAVALSALWKAADFAGRDARATGQRGGSGG